MRSELASGVSRSEVVALMKRRGFLLVDAIRTLRELFGVSLGDAKEIVAAHPAYRQAAKEVDPLHEEIIRFLNESAAGDADADGEQRLR
ncbi:MAG TPA: hypothetical protein VGE52_11465 [Pirellulales bacterium]